ncbi:hypothetical protein [Tersicoccus phoenicis]|uniref:hypothetical protein n=1 Tax=Tersicoccus phoenicis TaxID=554083 RepID=UPI0009FF8CBA|nr:hypothetical protein [Tersicoccus phoenicis]
MNALALAAAFVPRGILLPESVLYGHAFAVLSTFVAINTVMYAVLTIVKILPGVRLPRRRSGRRLRKETRSIYPDGPL